MTTTTIQKSKMATRDFDEKNLKQIKNLSKHDADDVKDFYYNFAKYTTEDKINATQKSTEITQQVLENLLELEKIRS